MQPVVAAPRSRLIINQTSERVAALIMKCLSVGFIGGTYMKSSLNVADAARRHGTRLWQFVALADAACLSQTRRAALLHAVDASRPISGGPIDVTSALCV